VNLLEDVGFKISLADHLGLEDVHDFKLDESSEHHEAPMIVVEGNFETQKMSSNPDTFATFKKLSNPEITQSSFLTTKKTSNPDNPAKISLDLTEDVTDFDKLWGTETKISLDLVNLADDVGLTETNKNRRKSAPAPGRNTVSDSVYIETKRSKRKSAPRQVSSDIGPSEARKRSRSTSPPSRRVSHAIQKEKDDDANLRRTSAHTKRVDLVEPGSLRATSPRRTNHVREKSDEKQNDARHGEPTPPSKRKDSHWKDEPTSPRRGRGDSHTTRDELVHSPTSARKSSHARSFDNSRKNIKPKDES